MNNLNLNQAYELMGTTNENIYKPIIQEIYGIVYKTAYRYSRVDFLGETFCGELKSRNLSINDFTETMIGFSKVEEGFKTLDWYKDHMPNYKVYFWFAFKEGLFSWEFNRNNYELNGGDSQKRIGGTTKRGYKDFKCHLYIKKEHLVKINDTPVWIHPLVLENSKKPLFKSLIPEGVCWLKINK